MGDTDDIAARPEDANPVSHLSLDARLPLLPEDIRRLLTVDEQAGFFYTLVDSAADAIIAHRADGSVVYANAEAALLLGYEHEARLLDIEPYGWVAPVQLSSAPRRIERILRDGCETFESGARRKDGEVIPTEVRSRRVDTPLGPIIVAIIRDISDRVQSRAALEHLAYHDGLTGLSNRPHLEDRLAIAIADARRYGDTLAMAYIDLDQFKPVNDRYGHAAGDDVLIEVARRLRECVREPDTVARLGGDEFVVVFPRLSSREEVEGIAARLVERIREPIIVGGYVITVGASVGVALFDTAVDDARSLLVKSDVAMYRAKLDQTNRWLVWEPGMGLPEQWDSGHHAGPAFAGAQPETVTEDPAAAR
jgi:diguanylate cyclase (GGDEF)-like protein/PAS domain S-box-containing protein